MIPKVIHYCWLGDGQMNILHRRCIESWKKYCPDFELQLWTEENSDIDDSSAALGSSISDIVGRFQEKGDRIQSATRSYIVPCVRQ